MPATCFSSVRGKAMRLTRVDSCGAVIPGAGGTLTTGGVVSVAYSMETDDGDDINVRTFDNSICVDEPACPVIRWVNVEATFCQVDPDAAAMFTGWPVVNDAEATAVGWRIRKEIQCTGGVGLEVWGQVSGQACEEGLPLYVYYLVPWLVQGIIGDFTVENDAASFTFSGKGIAGGAWGVGPYNVDRDVNGDPTTLLTAIGADDLMDIHLTTVPPPTPACGATTLTPVEPGE